MLTSKGHLVSDEKKFFVTIVHAVGSTEVPVYAGSIEEAQELAELKYEGAGYKVTRVRPEVK